MQHPNYNAITGVNDIALIQLWTPLEFSNLVRPACLNINTEDLGNGTSLTILGWGVTSTESNFELLVL